MKNFNVIILMCFILLISSCIEDNKKHEIAKRIEQIKVQIDSSTSDYDKEKLQERLAKLAGELVFEKYDCNSCHTIGKGRLIGPDLKGITKKREKVWLENWIRDSKQLIDSGDPIAIRIYNDYNQSPMLPYNLTDIEMDRLLEYLAEK